MKKKIYYNMRLKNISRNFSFLQKILKICRKGKMRQLHEQIWRLQLWDSKSTELERLRKKQQD